MGFLLDNIGTLSEAAGTITLQPSLLTMGGRQFKTDTLQVTPGGLTQLLWYRVYVVRSGGVNSLVVSTNKDTVGPPGALIWKLVGHFYGGRNSAGINAINKATADGKADLIPFQGTLTGGLNSLISGVLTTWQMASILYDTHDCANLTGDDIYLPRPTWYDIKVSLEVGHNGVNTRHFVKAQKDASTDLVLAMATGSNIGPAVATNSKSLFETPGVVRGRIQQDTGINRNTGTTPTHNFLDISAPATIIPDEDL